MSLIRRHPILTLTFALALALTLFFAVRFGVQVVYWSNPEHRNQQVQPWMTVGYIGKSWGLPAREIDALAGLPSPERGRPFTLEQIARDRGVPVAEVIAQVESALAVLLAQRALEKAAP
ncbi:MAG: hypothetical protein JXR75_07670 [Rhodobacteraceae bacterium]|nr:hypothetical protein [Paracoccaceae bacterium]